MEEDIKLVAHVIIHNKEAHSELEELCRKWKNEMYIDFEQSILSYKAEQESEVKDEDFR